MDIDVADLAITDKRAAELCAPLLNRLRAQIQSEFLALVAMAVSDEDTLRQKRIFDGANKAMERLEELRFEESVKNEPSEIDAHID